MVKKQMGRKEFLQDVNIGDLVNVFLKDQFFIEEEKSQIGVLTKLKVMEKSGEREDKDYLNHIFGVYQGTYFEMPNYILYLSTSHLCNLVIEEKQIKEVQVFKPTKSYKF